MTGSGCDPERPGAPRVPGTDAVVIGGVPDFKPALTPLERLALLCDENTLQLVRTRVGDPARPGDGVLGGSGRVGGRRVFCYAEDARVAGGRHGREHAETIVRIQELALKARVPVVGFVESRQAQGRGQDGLAALDGAARICAQHVALSGLVPQISVLTGAATGAAAGSPALTDFVVATRAARRPAATADFLVETDLDAIFLVRQLLDHLPQSAWSAAPAAYAADPERPEPGAVAGGAYDMRDVVLGIVDGESLLEVGAAQEGALVCAFARIEGRPVGIVASQPVCRGGAVDAAAAAAGARFVRTCDQFGVPLAVLVDSPGEAAEDLDAGRSAAALVRAFAEATVPRVTVVMGRAFGVAAVAMSSRALGADLVFAWPGARLGIAHGEEQVSAERAACAGCVDELIRPAETRSRLAWALGDGARPGRERGRFPI